MLRVLRLVLGLYVVGAWAAGAPIDSESLAKDDTCLAAEGEQCSLSALQRSSAVSAQAAEKAEAAAATTDEAAAPKAGHWPSWKDLGAAFHAAAEAVTEVLGKASDSVNEVVEPEGRDAAQDVPGKTSEVSKDNVGDGSEEASELTSELSKLLEQGRQVVGSVQEASTTPISSADLGEKARGIEDSAEQAANVVLDEGKEASSKAQGLVEQAMTKTVEKVSKAVDTSRDIVRSVMGSQTVTNISDILDKMYEAAGSVATSVEDLVAQALASARGTGSDLRGLTALELDRLCSAMADRLALVQGTSAHFSAATVDKIRTHVFHAMVALNNTAETNKGDVQAAARFAAESAAGAVDTSFAKLPEPAQRAVLEVVAEIAARTQAASHSTGRHQLKETNT